MISNIEELDARCAYLINRAEQVLGENKQQTTDNNKNILQASSKADNLSDKEIMETMISFTNDARRSAPTTQVFGPVISKHETNIKQAGKKEVDAEEMQRVFLEFSGLL